MSKRILSLMLCFVMVMSTLVAVPATVSAAVADGMVELKPDKTTAAPGDVITYTLTCGYIESVESMEIEIYPPEEGLTFVSGSNTAVSKSVIGWQAFDLNDRMANDGFLSITGYGGSGEMASQELASFQFTVDEGFSGVAEFSIEFSAFWDDNGDEYGDIVINNSAVTIEGASEPTVVNNVSVNDFVIPVAGTSAGAANPAGTVSDEGYTLTGSMWMNSTNEIQFTGNFVEGTTYTARFFLSAEDDYAFANPIAATVNGGNITVKETSVGTAERTNDRAVVVATFTAAAPPPMPVTATIADVDFGTVYEGYEEEVINPLVKNTSNTNFDLTHANVVITDGELTAFTCDWAEVPGTIGFNQTAAQAYVGSVEGLPVGTHTAELTLFYDYDGTEGAVYDWEALDTATVTITVVEAPTYTLTFVTDGSAVAPVTDVEGTVVDLAEYTTEKTGYTFDGWYIGEDKQTTITLNSDVTVTAKFTANSPVTDAVEINGVGYDTLAEALEAAKAMTGDVTVEVYDKVTLNQNLSGNFDSIKFVGMDADAEIYLEVQGYITATGKKVAFEDLTLSKSVGGFMANAGFMNVAFGVYDVNEVAYTNCTFANGAYASSGKVTFTECTFYRSHDKYGLWAYGNVEATVDDCTFADYRGIKMYAEGAAKTVELTVKNTDFSAVDNKPAIVLTYGESVELEGNTYSDTGVFELDLDGAPNGTTVTSDVPPTCKNDDGACGVLVDGKIYTTVEQAANAATSGSTVTLLHDSTETVEFPKGVELDKNGFTADNVTVKFSLAGEGTEEDPFLITSLDEFKKFRDDVNEGNSYDNQFVKLAVNIDLANEAWTPIGNTTYNNKYAPIDTDKIFSGVFDGNNKTISNLKIEKYLNGGADEDANLGLFGYIGEGAVIKDLTITNVDIKTDGRNVGTLAGVAYKATFDNITINGNIQITGGNNVCGVCAMTRYYAVSATNIKVSGNEGSSINGNNIVAGLFAEIAPNGSEQTFENLSVENVAINGVGGVGGIVGLLTNGTISTVSVKNVELVGKTLFNDDAMGRIRLGSVVGLLGSTSATVSNIVAVENVTAKNLDGDPVVLPVVGANYTGSVGNATEAKIGDKYYARLTGALDEVKSGDTITILADTTVDTTLEIPAGMSITLDLNGKTITGKDTVPSGNFALIKNKGTLEVKDTAGNGKITLAATTDRDWNALSAVISNEGGDLTITSGTLEHLGGSDMAYGIDNNSTLGETNLYVNGGTIISPYRAIRAFQNNKTQMNNIEINGGTIEGRVGVWMQQSGASSLGSLTVSNGTFDVYSNAIVVDTNSDAKTEVEITGGEFKNENENANLLLVWPQTTMANVSENNVTTLNIEGGTFECAGDGKLIGILDENDEELADAADMVDISGGTFNQAVQDDYFADGFAQKDNGDGTYGVDVAYTLTFATDGTAVESIKALVGTVVDLTEIVSTKEHYTFDGWFVGEDEVTEITLDADKTVTAKFTIDQHTLTFVTDGSVPEAVVADYNTTVDLTPYTSIKSGHTFDGWFSDAERTTPVSEVTLTADTTVYAKFTEISEGQTTYTITFVTDGSAVEPVTLLEGTVADLTTIVSTKEHYTLDGWFAEETLENEVTALTLTADTTVYAKFTINQYTITFVTDGSAVAPITEDYNTVVDLTTITSTKEGYTFGGWFAEEGLTTPVASVTLTADTTVYAKFTTASDRPSSGGGSLKKSYTVKFNSNGGTTLADKRVEIGGTLSEPTTPKRSGYKFEGWYTDKALTTPYNFGEEVTKNFTLYAKWTKVDGEDIDTPVTPVTPGWKFTDVKANDWFYDSVKFAVEKGWFNGVTEDTFAPNLPVTRGMLVTVLHRAEGNPAAVAGTPFADVDMGMYYGNAVAWAETNHIVEGVSETNFAPDQHITREQIAVIVYRYAKHKGLDVSVDETDISKYGDFSEISEYAVDAMKYAIANGIIKGKSATTLDPKAETTRADVTVIFQRIFAK